MIKSMSTLEMFIDKIMKLETGQLFLIVTDSDARPRNVGKTVMELANARKIETVMMIMSPRSHQGHEPPKLIAQAMKSANVILEVIDRFDCTHTTARMEASAAGAKYFLTSTGISEDYLHKEMTIADLETIRDLTNRVSQRLTLASIAKVTTPFGTDVSMDVEGRQGLSLHPLHDAAVSMLPDYAEAAISPNEGSTHGYVVVDAAIQEWGHTLQ
jgi:leucyl aminopeptidase (aminopeptidase T)